MSFERPNAEIFRGLNLTDLSIDEAFLNVTSSEDKHNLTLYLLNEDCVRCPFKRQDQSSPGESTYVLSTHHPWTIRIRNESTKEFILPQNEDRNLVCEVQDVQLGQFGVYDLTVKDQKCTFQTALEPVNTNLAILYCFLILLAIGIVYQVFEFARRKVAFRVKEETLPNPVEPAKPPGKQRLRSLDTFRGITIASMIFVNDGAGGFWFLEHATWNGLQFADLVFPWFLWIMGFCIPMSIRSLNRNKTPTGVALIGILRRSAVLFLLGLMWNTSGWIYLERWRIPGVLQRFAITYLIVASSAFLFGKSNDKIQPTGFMHHFADIIAIWPQWVVAIIFLVSHFLIVYLLPVPGCPTGYFGPGGLGDDDQYPGECIGGATGYVDRVIFGVDHIYGHPTAKVVYNSGAFDPEGIVGSFLSVVQVFIGYQGGQIILTFSKHRDRVIRFVIWALVTASIGIALCGASRDEGLIPINKNLWSLSFVMVTSALAFFLIAIVYVLVDVKQWWFGEPFLAAGMNSILLYLGHQTASNMLPFNFSYGNMNSHWIKLIESLWGVSAWLLVAFFLYKKKIFVTV